MPFQCSICDEPSTRICVRCTKDACENHLCEKCLKCSDCCECEVALDATRRLTPVVHTPPAEESDAGVEVEAGGAAEDAEAEEAEAEPAVAVGEEPEQDPTALPGTNASETQEPSEVAQPIPAGE